MSEGGELTRYTHDKETLEQHTDQKKEYVTPREFMSAGQALNILRYPSFRRDTSLDYPHTRDTKYELLHYDLIGASNEIHSWDTQEDREVAVQGFNEFMRVFSEEACNKLGIPLPSDEQPDFHTFGTTEGAYEILLGDDYKEKYGARYDLDNPSLPVVRYQDVRNRLKQRPGKNKWGGFRKFVGFGTQGDIVAKSPDFDESVRLYLNPTLKDTAHLTAQICKKFIQQYGYMPRGKFMEDATSYENNIRDDRLIFYLQTPEELAAILQITKDIEEESPEFFANREAILTGEPVIIDGRELPTARLAQDIPGNSDSFNSLMERLLRKGMSQEFSSLYVPNPSEDDARRYIERLRQLAPEFGRNPKSISFNEGQNLDVIYDSVDKVE